MRGQRTRGRGGKFFRMGAGSRSRSQARAERAADRSQKRAEKREAFKQEEE